MNNELDELYNNLNELKRREDILNDTLIGAARDDSIGKRHEPFYKELGEIAARKKEIEAKINSITGVDNHITGRKR